MTREFARHFRDLVVPRLHNLVRAEAVCVHHGVETFNDACAVVMRHARMFGATHLPSDVLLDLDDWISTTLLRETIAADAAAGSRDEFL